LLNFFSCRKTLLRGISVDERGKAGCKDSQGTWCHERLTKIAEEWYEQIVRQFSVVCFPVLQDLMRDNVVLIVVTIVALVRVRISDRRLLHVALDVAFCWLYQNSMYWHGRFSDC
jgi:hypothetical protein